MTSIKPDSIDVTAGDWERLDKLIKIINNILDDTDSGDDNKDKRRWILWHFLYIMWHEGDRATTRVQGGGGPGRGLMQIEPRTLWDLFKNYVLGLTPGLVKNLADAAGVSEKEMKEAIDDFVNNNHEDVIDKNGNPVPETDSNGNPITGADGKPKIKQQGKNSWPDTPTPPTQPPPRTKIEKWIKEIDSFGIKLTRLQFKQYKNHQFPGADGKFKGDCKDAIEAQTDGWAKWWKRKFDGDDDEKTKKDQFRGHAKDLNKVAEACEAKEKEKKEKEEKEKKEKEGGDKKEEGGGLKSQKSLRFIIGGIIIGAALILIYLFSTNRG